MKTINEVRLLGYAGRDGEVRNTKTGKRLGKFSLATGGGLKKDGSKYPLDWHNCSSWGDELCQVVEEIRKGDAVEVYGRIAYSSSGKDGVKRYYTDIVCSKIILEDRGEAQSTGKDEPLDDSKIPF
jgi:single-strand DNA-binding protein